MGTALRPGAGPSWGQGTRGCRREADTLLCPEGPSSLKSPETLVLFVFKFLSSGKLSRRGNKEAASRGSRAAGAGRRKDQCQPEAMPGSRAKTPQVPEPLAGMTLGGGNWKGPLLPKPHLRTPPKPSRGGSMRTGPQRRRKREGDRGERERDAERQGSLTEGERASQCWAPSGPASQPGDDPEASEPGRPRPPIWAQLGTKATEGAGRRSGWRPASGPSGRQQGRE